MVKHQTAMLKILSSSPKYRRFISQLIFKYIRILILVGINLIYVFFWELILYVIKYFHKIQVIN